MMDIVVKLPDKDYEVILTKIMLACYGCKVVELPKGHGRLIDADALPEISLFGTTEYINVKKAPTIVEADTESEAKE